MVTSNIISGCHGSLLYIELCGSRKFCSVPIVRLGNFKAVAQVSRPSMLETVKQRLKVKRKKYFPTGGRMSMALTRL